MSTLTEGRHPGEFLIGEQAGTLSRDQVTVTVAGSTELAPGTVLGKITASGKYVVYDNDSSDGREVAAGILHGTLDNESVSAADMDATIINFGAEVRADDLTWGDDSHASAGLVDLAALFIKAR